MQLKLKKFYLLITFLLGGPGSVYGLDHYKKMDEFLRNFESFLYHYTVQ